MSQSVIRQRWRTRKLTGEYKNALIVRVRPGHMGRGYSSQRRIDDGSTPYDGSPIFPPLIYGGHNHDCWKGVWVADGPWQELPSIQNVKWGRTFDMQTGGQQGSTTATILMDNLAFPEELGIGGLYYETRRRGYYSPMRGVAVKGRADPWPEDVSNEWEQALNSGWQVEVWEGWGQGDDIVLKTVLDPTTNSYAPDSGALDRTFTGIVLTCETESNPDHITITAQDFGIYLTDARPLGQNKAPEVPSPVTFADRKRTFGEQTIAGPYTVSDGSVSDDGAWTSGVHGSGGNAWIEVALRAGHYEDFFVAPQFEGMEMHVSLYLNGTGSMGVHTLGPGWVTVTGYGGTIDGIPYMWKATPAESPTRRWSIQPPVALDWFGCQVPDGSKLRLTFSKLHLTNDGYRAGTHKFVTYRFGHDPLHPPPGTPPTNAKGWILVEDASEVVRMVLIWCGFQEWHVEDFKWSLFSPLIFGADKFFIEIINDMLQQGSFIWYVGQPTNDDRSIGVPHFEHIHVLDPPPNNMVEVRDTDMSEKLQVKWDLANLPLVIRYTGAITKRGGHEIFGFGIEGLTRRYLATYHPPWSGNWQGALRDIGTATFNSVVGHRRIAGILRQFTETMGMTAYTQLRSDEECLFACVLAAIAYALNMVTAQCQIPGLSGLDLNRQINVLDRASAVNSRMWLASVESEHQVGIGENPGYWRMTVGGSLIDTPDMAALVDDYNYAWKANQRNKASFV